MPCGRTANAKGLLGSGARSTSSTATSSNGAPRRIATRTRSPLRTDTPCCRGEPVLDVFGKERQRDVAHDDANETRGACGHAVNDDALAGPFLDKGQAGQPGFNIDSHFRVRCCGLIFRADPRLSPSRVVGGTVVGDRVVALVRLTLTT